MSTLADFDAVAIDGAHVPLGRYLGSVVLVVNVASACGFTPQYRGLEALYRQYKDRGFVVLGFPCNQFGRQEPGADAEIAAFCAATYGVTFPMLAKIDVNGPSAHPLFRWLTSERRGFLGTRGIKWNFSKFLIGRDGRALKRYGPRTTPAALARDLDFS
jgi:glutathione peroxidase